jgi:flagellar motor switch protein FliN/FliY
MNQDDAQAPQSEAPSTSPATEAEVRAVEFAEQVQPLSKPPQNNLDLVLDINVPITVRLGQAEMSIDALLALAAGSVVELDRLASDPVDILVRDKLIARGEVVLVDENFGVRITSVLDASERLTSATTTR